MADLHPVLPIVLAALVLPLLPRTIGKLVSLLGPALSVASVFAIPEGAPVAFEAVGRRWVLLEVDELSRVFAIAFALYAVIASCYAWSRDGVWEKVASLGLAAGGVGVVLAGDLLTLFFFWELLSVTSFFLIWMGGGRGALAAGTHYLYFHVAGGMCLLAGILLLLSGDDPGLARVPLDGAAGWLILIGVATNAAVPPLHAWLSDAYPRASVYGTVFLAAFTTKAAVYVLARLFPGADVLVWGGAVMALYGVVFAVLENDIRRLLAYHIISQVGYMVCGAGLGTLMAINGAAAHAFAHIFYKGLLLMSAGAVIYATGRGKLTELGALARPLLWTFIFCMIGGFSISGVPLFNGFVSKSIIVSASAESHRPAIELMLLVASMGTFLHTGLKLPWFTFFSTDKGARVERPVPASMYIAMGLAALVCIVTGVYPRLLYDLLPHEVDYHPYTADHVVGTLEILTGTALGFWILRGKLGGERTVTLDVDRLYRAPSRWLVEGSGAALETAGRVTDRVIGATLAASWAACVRYQVLTRQSSLAYQVSVVLAVLAAIAYIAFSLG